MHARASLHSNCMAATSWSWCHLSEGHALQVIYPASPVTHLLVISIGVRHPLPRSPAVMLRLLH